MMRKPIVLIGSSIGLCLCICISTIVVFYSINIWGPLIPALSETTSEEIVVEVKNYRLSNGKTVQDQLYWMRNKLSQDGVGSPTTYEKWTTRRQSGDLWIVSYQWSVKRIPGSDQRAMDSIEDQVMRFYYDALKKELTGANDQAKAFLGTAQ